MSSATGKNEDDPPHHSIIEEDGSNRLLRMGKTEFSKRPGRETHFRALNGLSPLLWILALVLPGIT